MIYRRKEKTAASEHPVNDHRVSCQKLNHKEAELKLGYKISYIIIYLYISVSGV